MVRIRRRQLLRGERNGGAEQPTEAVTHLAQARQRCDRHVQLRGADATDRVAVRVTHEVVTRVVQLESGHRRWSSALTRPCHQGVQRGSDHIGVRAGVDRRGAGDHPEVHRRGRRAHRVEQGRVRRDRAVVGIADAQAVGVRVGGAADLPSGEGLGVGLTCACVAEPVADQVGLGGEHQDRSLQVGARERRIGRGERRLRGSGERCTRAGTAVHQVAVEHVVQRGDGVHVGGQAERGLRLAHREHHVGNQLAQDLLGREPHRCAGLAEHVVAVVVARVTQWPVPHRVGVLQGEQRAEWVASALDAGLLRGHTDPRGPRAHDLLVGVGPVRIGVQTTRHVEPLGDDGAVEVGGIGRSAHHDAGRVRRRGVGRDGPLTVLGQRFG